MRGQVGDLYTGHALLTCPPPHPHTLSGAGLLAQMSDHAIEACCHWRTPKVCWMLCPRRSRGSIRGKLEGCHSNVIGLSLPLLRQMLDQLGYDITDFGSFRLNTNMLNRFCGQRAHARCSWSSSERKIDRCLALFHHDRESTLPTQTLRSDRVAVLRQS